MEINGKKLANTILKHLKDDVLETKKKHKLNPPKLVIFSVNPDKVTKSFMESKRKAITKIGGKIDIISYKKSPPFEDFATKVNDMAHDNTVHAVVIQHPLPASLSTVSLFDYIPLEKEIEGIKKKAPFEHPIGLAVLTAIKKVYSPEAGEKFENIIVKIDKDTALFKQVFKRKKVVLIGRGKTGGALIGDTLTKAKINYINLNSKTSNTDMFLKQSDMIVSAVGAKAIKADQVKEGSVLISVGMRKVGRKWRGDFDQNKIKDKVLAYTPTPDGIGPINVAYLMYNLVRAWKIQNGLKVDEEKK